MAQATRRLLPWGLLIALLVLAGGVVGVLRWRPGSEAPVPWPGVFAAVTAAFATFLFFRGLSHSLWGLIAAFLLILHPHLYWNWTSEREFLFLAVALELVILAFSVGIWRQVFASHFSGAAWVLIAAVCSAGLSLAWAVQPRSGLVATVLVAAGLAWAMILGLRQRPGPNLANLIVAGGLALLGPAAGVGLALYGENLDNVPRHPDLPRNGDLATYLQAAVGPDFSAGVPGFTADLDFWAWPLAWLVVLLLAYGAWRAVRRGWSQRAQRHPPVAWVLALFAGLEILGVVLQPAAPREVAPLAALAVLLSAFGVADFFRGISERLVLAPPPHE